MRIKTPKVENAESVLLNQLIADGDNQYIELSSDDVSPSTAYPNVKPGDLADHGEVRQLFSSIHDDLTFIGTADNLLKSAILRTYNTILTQENGIVGRLQKLASKIELIKLYSNIQDRSKGTVLIDFKDPTVLDPSASKDVSVYGVEGVATLPIITAKIIPVQSVSIIGESNGRAGNNLDRSRPRHSDVRALSDSDIDSWFEYEKISSSTSDTLSLQLELKLADPIIINRLEIDMLDLGLSKIAEIKSIKASTLNGSFEINDFTKIADKVSVTFSPLTVKSIMIDIVQSSSYPISPNEVRYVIGIREVSLFQIEFAKEGLFETKTLELPRPVKTFNINDNISCLDPSSQISYEYSTDMKKSWNPIATVYNDSSTLTEAVTSEAPISSISIRTKIVKDETLFQGQEAIGAISPDKELLTSINSNSNTTITLESEPHTYCQITQLGLGSVGTNANPLFAGTISTSAEPNVMTLPYPWDRENMLVVAKGELWPVVDFFTGPNHSGVLYDETVHPPILIFGDGLGTDEGLSGRKPEAGSEIYVHLAPDTKVKVSKADKYELELSYPCDKIKQTTRIVLTDFQETSAKVTTIAIGPGQKSVPFPKGHQVIAITSITSSSDTYLPLENGDELFTLSSSSGFKNGRTEFAGIAGKNFSTDWDNGIVYFSPAVPNSSPDLIMTYFYNEVQILEPEDYDFHPSRNSIIINNQDLFGLKTKTRTLEAEVNSRRLRLSENSIVSHTIVAVATPGSTLPRTIESELDFINGAEEFKGLSNTDGFYSVDYSNGYIYLPSGSFFPPGKIRFDEVSIEAEYGIGSVLREGTDYTIDKGKVILTAAFTNNFAEAGRNKPSRARLLIKYDVNPSPQKNPIELAKYYSPAIKQIMINGISTDPRLGTIESL